MIASEEAPRASPRVVEAQGISALLAAILDSGYRLLGPTVKDGAIVIDEISSAAALPKGVGQEQTNGRYRLRARGDGALFGYAVGPHAWKKFLFPASRRLFSATRREKTLQIERDRGGRAAGRVPRRQALRPRGDRAAGPRLPRRSVPRPGLRARREEALLVAVQCGEAEGTCFCASLGTGPRAVLGLRPRAHGAPRRRAARVRRRDRLGARRGPAREIEARPARPADLEAARAATSPGRGGDGPDAGHRRA